MSADLSGVEVPPTSEAQKSKLMSPAHKKKILGATKDLEENWAISACINLMFARGVITMAEKVDLDEIDVEFSKVTEFLKMLLQKDDVMFDALVAVLQEVGQFHIEKALLEGDVPKKKDDTKKPANGECMTDKHREQITKANQALVENWAISHCISSMLAQGVLVQRENLILGKIRGEGRKVDAFVKMFLQKPDSAYQKLIDILEDCEQDHISKLLR